MFFSNDDEDHEFSPAQGGSKLASLFGIDKAHSKGGNESLTYTAPKEPKKVKGDQAAGDTPSVICAIAVHAYKFTDGKYASQGKLGAALLANPAKLDYKILLYVSKSQQVTNARITSTFKFTVQSGNYASFYDDARQNWSIAFDGEEAIYQFAKQVCLAKAHCVGKHFDNVIIQDLPPLGDGGSLESGDSVEMKYTGYILEDNTCGPIFDSNASADKLLRYKVGKGKCLKALDDGSVGMKRGGKRLLVVPPQLGYGSEGKGNVPPEAVLVYEIETVRVKLQKDKDGDTSPVASDVQNTPNIDTANEADDDFKARSKSVSEQLTQPSGKSDKAKLISRMAKMGKPMLPMTGAVSNIPGPEEQEPQPVIPEPAKPQIATKPVTPTAAVTTGPPLTVPYAMPVQQGVQYPVQLQPQHIYAPPVQTHPLPLDPSVMQGVPQSTQVALLQPQIPFQQPSFQPYGQHPPQYNHMYGQAQPVPTHPPAPPPQADPSVPVLLSETRQQNTEVRVSLTRVSDKVDRMHEQIEQMLRQQSNAMAITNSGVNMETNALMTTIQRIVKENEQLKKDVLDKGARIESQNEKISDLLQRNQKYIEQSNSLLEERNDSFKVTATSNQAKVLMLEQEKVQLATELSTTTAQTGELQLELVSIRKKEGELRSQLLSMLSNDEQSQNDLSGLRVQVAESARKLQEANTGLKEERQERKSLESQLTALQDETLDLKTAKTNADKALSEKKKKSTQEKNQLEVEIEELKQQHEKETTSLKEKLRVSKVSSDTSLSDQVTKVEEELGREWQEKCDRLVSAAQDKPKRELEALKEEKLQIEETLSAIQNKMSSLKSSAGDKDRDLLALQDQVEELKLWKQKYDTLRSNAATFKERYENRLAEVEKQRDEMEEALQKAELERDKVLDSSRRATKSSDNAPSKDVIAVEVKKVMNSVYQELKPQFVPNKSFSGEDVQGMILNTVKSVTLRMVQSSKKESQAGEEVIAAQSASVTTSSAKGLGTGMPIVSSTASITGDKGNPQYAKELDQRGKDLKETANVTGDKGNPHYAAELSGKGADKSLKDTEKAKNRPTNAAILAAVESCIIPDAASPESKNKQTNLSILSAVESLIVPGDETKAVGGSTESQPTIIRDTDKGILASVEACIIPEVSDKASKEPPKDSQPKSTQAAMISAFEACIIPDVSGNTSKEPPKDSQPKSTQAAMISAVEACILPDVAASTGAIPKKPSGKQGKSNKTNTAIIASIESMVVPNKETKKVGSDRKAKGAKSAIISAVEKMIVPSTTHVTGDKGNPHYAKELQSAPSSTQAAIFASVEACILPDGTVPTSGNGKSTNAEDSTKRPRDSTIKPQKANVTGDRGNVHYAKELDKDGSNPPSSDLEEQIISPQSSVSTSSSAPSISHDGGSNKKDLPSKITKEVANRTGDKGNPHYADELNKVEPKVDPVKAPVTGDKGNVHYAQELDKAAEVEIAPVVASESKGSAPQKPDKKTESHKTGDKGNPHYAAELDKAASREAPIKKETGNITGDKGNVHYAKELNQTGQEKDSHSTKGNESGTAKQDPLADAVSPKIISAVEKQILLDVEKSTGKPEKNKDKKGDSTNKSKGNESDDKAKKAAAAAALFGDDDDPLFGKGTPTEDNGGLFTGSKSAKPKTSKTPAEKKQKLNTKEQKKEQADSDDGMKPTPPPLFGDDEDDDDLDWLS